MFSRSLGIAAICSVAVHALLLPPGTENNDLFNPLVNPKARSIQLPCSSCAFPSGDNDEDLGSEGQIWLHSNYQLNLAFDVSSNGQRLELNNEAIYPDQFLRDAYIQGRPLYVNQISPSGIVSTVTCGLGWPARSHRGAVSSRVCTRDGTAALPFVSWR